MDDGREQSAGIRTLSAPEITGVTCTLSGSVQVPVNMRTSPTIAVVLACLVSGCSTVNFSANYYTLPASYDSEVLGVWSTLAVRFTLPSDYSLRVLTGEDERKSKGIPFISGHTVYLPEIFIKYVYQNYYDDRLIVLTSVITHEICHKLYDLPSEPADEHFKTDAAAIKLLGTSQETVRNYYNSLVVVKNYCFARKGMAGHTLNVGLNALSVGSMVMGGPGVFIDLYATDLTRRIKLIKRAFGLGSVKGFAKTHEQRK